MNDVEIFVGYVKEAISQEEDIGWDRACRIVNKAKREFDASQEKAE